MACGPVFPNTVEHTYDTCPKYSELESFRIIAYLYVSYGLERKYKWKSTAFLFIAKQNHTLYVNKRRSCVFYSNHFAK